MIAIKNSLSCKNKIPIGIFYFFKKPSVGFSLFYLFVVFRGIGFGTKTEKESELWKAGESDHHLDTLEIHFFTFTCLRKHLRRIEETKK